MLLVLASAVFLGSESLGTSDHILCLRFETFLFVASYDSQGHGGGIRPRLHAGSRYIASGRTAKKIVLLLTLCVYSLPIHGSLVWWYKSVFTVPLPDSGWRLLLSYSVMSQWKESSSSSASGELVSPFSPQTSSHLIIFFLVYLDIAFLSVDNISLLAMAFL
jgi:hypothetical protein